MRLKEDYIIVCRDRSTGTLSIFDHMGTKYMTKETADERQRQWTHDYPHMAYRVVRFPE